MNPAPDTLAADLDDAARTDRDERRLDHYELRLLRDTPRDGLTITGPECPTCRVPSWGWSETTGDITCPHQAAADATPGESPF